MGSLNVVFQIVVRSIALIGAFLTLPALAQQPAPPDVPLWTLEADGDAIQNDLGFVLPPTWKGFERKGFTSTRPDGGSVMAHYERADGPLRMRILISLRGDVRGATVPGADATERNWSMAETAGSIEYRSRTTEKPEKLADLRIGWGKGDHDNARMQLLRYALPNSVEVQGIWHTNIGLWSVVVTISGPLDHRTEIEELGRAARMDIKWPSAPLNAELRAIASVFLRAVPACGESFDRSGTGKQVKVDKTIAAEMGINLARIFLGEPPVLPHPVRDGSSYCRLDSFKVGDREVIALAWRGDPDARWSARWAFMVANSGTFFQVESPVSPQFGAAPKTALGIRKAAALIWSDDRSMAVLHAFTDWPSFADAKALTISAMSQLPSPIVEVKAPPKAIDIRIDPSMVVELPASAGN
jgi:hypothetical protein